MHPSYSALYVQDLCLEFLFVSPNRSHGGRSPGLNAFVFIEDFIILRTLNNCNRFSTLSSEQCCFWGFDIVPMFVENHCFYY